MSLFSGSIANLERGLNFSALKNKVIAQNIANVDTPNYQAKDVSFSQLLNDAKQSSLTAYRTDNRHFEFRGTGGVATSTFASRFRYRSNGNGVDMDKEQANLATNTIYYNALVDRMNGKLNTLQNVIKGGK